VTGVTLCANASDGVAPYAYRWSNGATTQCIAVSDTGSYTVTITDAKGCVASDSGVLRWRDCVGQLAHTSATCTSYQAGTAEDLPSSDVNYGLRDGRISTISPGVFFYFTKVEAPRAGFTIHLTQTKTNPVFPFCEIQQGQIRLYDANCNPLGEGRETGPGQAAIDVTGATPGQVFIAQVKYSLKSLLDTPMPPGCRFDFLTLIDGQVVDSDPDGLLVGNPSVTGIGDPPLPGDDTLVPWRPVPNPFHGAMRMAYVVTRHEETVNLRVYDLAGRLVRTLASGTKPAGRYVAAWDGHDDRGMAVRSGIYFVRGQVGTQTRRTQVTLLR
jgi:hypothetical protein